MRIDGSNCSKLTKRLSVKKPFDPFFAKSMAAAGIEAAKRIQGCVLGYTQSDEMTLITRTDQSEATTPWFDNRIQKMASVPASLVTAAFNKIIETDELITFDCKVWAMPSMTEVVNDLIFRQRDCERNSISNAVYYDLGKVVGSSAARKMSHKLNSNQRQELLFQKAGINWSKYPAEFKRGIVFFRTIKEITTENGTAIRSPWIYEAAPIFTSDKGREWLNIILNPVRSSDV